MAEVSTFSEFYEIGRAEMIARDVHSRLTDTSFAPGGMIDLFLGSSAAMAEQQATISLELYMRTYLSRAEGEHLTQLVADHWSLTRQGIVSAVGQVTFSRVSASGAVSIEAGTLVAAGDVQFQTTSSVTMTGTSITAPVAAVVGGIEGNVGIGTVTTVVSSLSDPTITVANTEIMAGGRSAEEDYELRDRTRRYIQTLQKGTEAAVLAEAYAYPGVVNVGADETTEPPTLYIADVNGTANTALLAGVLEALRNARALGVPVNVAAGTLVNTSVTISLTFSPNVDTLQASHLAKKAIEAYSATLQIGATLYTSQIQTAAISVPGILDCAVSVPAGNVAPAAGELLRVPFAQITVS